MKCSKNLCGARPIESLGDLSGSFDHLGHRSIGLDRRDGGFQTDLAIPDAEVVTRCEWCFSYWIAVEKGAVRGIQIDNFPLVSLQGQSSVKAAGGVVVDAYVCCRIAADDDAICSSLSR
ncbi:MAG: hypothetical protein VX764_10300 [Planctomycetota bacterium]|nr:hypothetical protein [Planctomycetota bacterium]